MVVTPANQAPAAPPNADIDLTVGVVSGAPKLLLRLEGLAVLGMSLLAYSHLGVSWWLFAVLFLVPDLSMLGYLAGPSKGAVFYNLGHSYLLPAVLGVTSLLIASSLALSVALIWAAHIGFDRAVGYGLKYGDAFKHTHLGVPFSGDRA